MQNIIKNPLNIGSKNEMNSRNEKPNVNLLENTLRKIGTMLNIQQLANYK
jgi:hypothetical protein